MSAFNVLTTSVLCVCVSQAKEAALEKKQTQLVFPNEVERHMQYMWKRETELLSYMYGHKGFGETRAIQVLLSIHFIACSVLASVCGCMYV